MYKIKFFIIMIIVFIGIFHSCVKNDISTARIGQTYNVVKITEPPIIDGILNDACWNEAFAAALVLSRDGSRPSYPTSVRAVWDEEKLYIGFECQDPDAASTEKERDGPVSIQEYVSVYIDANADSVSYAMIEVAPTAAVYDAFVLSRRNSGFNKILASWNCEGLRVSVSVYGGGAQPGTEDRFWTVEMAIPFHEFVTAPRSPPGDGDIWRVNFYRMELTDVKEFSSFAPTGSGSGHKTDKFAWLYFRRISNGTGKKSNL